jgi:hypothetical protein
MMPPPMPGRFSLAHRLASFFWYFIPLLPDRTGQYRKYRLSVKQFIRSPGLLA